jgi:hypothetical protein
MAQVLEHLFSKSELVFLSSLVFYDPGRHWLVLILSPLHLDNLFYTTEVARNDVE